MMWSDLLAAFALYLVIEGVLPFLNPDALRRAMQSVVSLEDRTLRIAGLASMASGAVLLYWVRG